MDVILSGGTGLRRQGLNNQPGQSERDTTGRKKNGRASSGKGTRHINIRYFFVADRVASNEVSIEYCCCPTGEMIADFFTKPLQGSLFQKFRDFIMNKSLRGLH
jgi:hypothetical protein